MQRRDQRMKKIDRDKVEEVKESIVGKWKYSGTLHLPRLCPAYGKTYDACGKTKHL